MNYTVHGILQARILEWVDLPFSRGSSQPRDWTQVSHIAGIFFTSWHTREALSIYNYHKNWLYSLCYTIYILQEKAMTPHSSTLAWKIPWTEEPGRLQSMGSLESDTTERLHFPFSLSCIGEGNGNPLQCSCLENPREGKPSGLPSMRSHRVRHDWSDLAAAAAAYIFQVYFIGNSLYLLMPSSYTAFPTSLSLLVATSLFSVSLRLFLIWLYILVCCIFISVPYNICLSLNYFT